MELDLTVNNIKGIEKKEIIVINDTNCQELKNLPKSPQGQPEYKLYNEDILGKFSAKTGQGAPLTIGTIGTQGNSTSSNIGQGAPLTFGTIGPKGNSTSSNIGQ